VIVSFYCDFAPGHEWHGPYHDSEYGFPLQGDAELFERLILEINQAGLSWLTILKKREALRAAYRGFDPAAVARFGARDVRRLMADAGIIRNRLKIEAAIANAKTVLALRTSHGSLAGWLDDHLAVDGTTPRRKGAKRARTREEWVALFKQTFRFTGGEIVGEFLLSTGYLPGAHRTTCPVYARVLAAGPPFLRAT
jgi:DNA-3-methyladenine glycosylase I